MTKGKKDPEDDMKQDIKNILDKLTTMETKLNNVLEENERLKADAIKRDQEFAQLNRRVHFLEQRTRINNLEIMDFPTTINEDPVEIVKQVCSTLKVSIRNEDIQVAHRVPRFNKAATKNIVVNLCSRWKKMEIIRAAKKYRKENNNKIVAKDINKNLPSKEVFISEHLTPHFKQLLSKTKVAAKEKNWKYVWVRDCQIYAKKSDTDKNVVTVGDVLDLTNII
uniref:FP protein C-terminal domain-containing protein n=1 Tax=Cacopsylla melanoneura TaxID=428564 RepID=A0A8D9A006_9HEMI